MDSLTQIVLGGAVGEAVLGRKVGNRAILWGAVAGTIPDLDVFVGQLFDKMTALEMHRGFSHSIVFSIVAAPLLALIILQFGKLHRWLVLKLKKRKVASRGSLKDWTKLAFWGFITHPLLDCHTSWGTQLLWPLDYKIAYNNIFVVDPIYTIPFLLLLIIVMTLKRESPKRRLINRWGLIISSCYMILTLGLKWRAHFNVSKYLQSQGVNYNEISTRPSPFNSILWMVNVDTDENYLVGMYSLLDKQEKFDYHIHPKNRHLDLDFEEEDLFQRIVKLSQGWYAAVDLGDTLLINDLRFGQMGEAKEAPFVFRYFLYRENGELKLGFRDPEPDPKEMKKQMSKLWTRLKGI
ncbi:MAG: metal-dependent hydrolase [Flavobacteriales bacterium]|nr:metal-dependent hydrolase [Flavobacteriales bacterium]